MKTGACRGIAYHGLMSLNVRFKTDDNYEEAGFPRPRFCPLCGGHMKDRYAALWIDGDAFDVAMDVFVDVDEA